MMVQAPSQQSLVLETLAHVPSLAHAVYGGIQDELKSRLEHHQLMAGWSKRRAHFSADLEASLSRLLNLAAEGKDPLARDRQVIHSDSLSLSLVDENQALKDVAIAHVITTIEDSTRAELHQLGNFFGALRGIARPLKSDNPLRAAVFAHALSRAIEGVDLDADGRYKLMRIAALPLARQLQPIFTLLCRELRQAQLSGMLQSHGSAVKESDLRMRQFKALNQNPQAPNTTLDEVALLLDAVTRPHQLDEVVSPRLGPGAPGSAKGGDLLSRLYDQILADTSLQPQLKVLMGRLQVAIVRLSRLDVTLLKRQDHPTWLLLNRIAAHGAGYRNADDPGLLAFLQLVDRSIQPLIAAEQPAASQFKQALVEVERYIREQAEQHSQPSTGALERLDREQQRQEWQRLLREQLQHQLDDANAGKLMRRFLLGPWVEVIAQAMVQFGRESEQAALYVDLVDGLLHSVQPHADDVARQRLRARLPQLVQSLEQGMDSISLPPLQRQAFMNELMRQHGRVLRGLPADETVATDSAPRRPALTPEEVLQQLLAERESQLPSRWAHERVDRGQLPTVPIGLFADERSPDAKVALQQWINGMEIGNWYHLFIKSEWVTAQIAWISDSGQLFLFVSQLPDDRHSLTRGALEQLVVNGLITMLEPEPLLQRAIGTLMQDLEQQR
ncbi:DUF1631 family protein [Roseateles depolymerans]|uniref:Uncharacterized protein n=1 Tax=Roseateles depolymerans TaxID=76731 RepID=A0A0U3NJV8_9BURK|nr:DUF1631 family protein [Roseateles depolymerans]ALV08704.1 hypothetical protein RD2015_4258 [Roseateles depolymerans]REG21069.1 uncharacterized protein DUF1631 [Roseateles depolymerans]